MSKAVSKEEEGRRVA
jgi:hypothetical protein